MTFSDIIGLRPIKSHLQTTADRGRVPHAQLFVGPDGRGTLAMAIAYAEYLLCGPKKTEEEKRNCASKIQKLIHPDLHFAYPIAKNEKVRNQTKFNVSDFLTEWRTFVTTYPYGNVHQWYQTLGIENKQGRIGIEDGKEIANNLALKSYDGGYKIMIIWHAEALNISAANYLLKLIEEPPAKTVFILITENEGRILETIRSRCQKLSFPPIGEEDLWQALLQNHNCTPEDAQKYAIQAEGNYAKAVQLITSDEDSIQFEKWFIDWVRTAFSAAGRKGAILNLLSWSEEISATNRETQKRFLHYCLDFMRQALLQNYNAQSLVYLQPNRVDFKLKNFAPFIHGHNIIELVKELETAIYHIERNGNSKIILTDLSIQLTRLLHQKEKHLSE